MPYPGFEPSPYGTAVSVTNHYTGRAAHGRLVVVNGLSWSGAIKDIPFTHKMSDVSYPKGDRTSLSRGDRKKSGGLRFGKNGGCSTCITPFFRGTV
ncbi:hypothetical protein TNCV_873521 [Trichonephila clavipes]|nr:hypothetical protein TNCV_873521 [Trichonephila clavipes]